MIIILIYQKSNNKYQNLNKYKLFCINFFKNISEKQYELYKSRFNNNNWSLIKITTFIDKIININEFVRTIGNKVYYFLDNKLYFI